MAKRTRKSSTALFEVIHASKRELAVPAFSRAPRSGGWWFNRGRDRSQPVAVAATPAASQPIATDPTDPTANVTAAMLLAPRAAAVVEPPEPAPAPPPAAAPLPPTPPPAAIVPATPPARTDVYEDGADEDDDDLAPTPALPARTSSSRDDDNALFKTRSGMQFALDRDRQVVTLRMRYTAAIVTAFSVLVVIGLAYVFGRRLAEGPTRARASATTPASTSAQLKQGAPQPSVMGTGRPAGKGAAPRGPDPFAAPAGGAGTPSRGAAESAAFVDAPPLDAGGVQRITNLNYVFMQSYPPESQNVAYEVANGLTANGVGCTVERVDGLRLATKGWYSVIGTRGFAPRFGQSPEYASYFKSLDAAIKKLPKRSKFTKPEPRAFKWTE